MIKHHWMIGLAATVCVGCAADGTRQIERTERSLIAAGDADSLAAAALMTVGPTSDPNARMSLIAQAVSKAPQRPDLVWLNLRLCAQVEACDPAPLEATLRALEPSNGAAWIDSIGRARTRNDAAALREGLAAVAKSSRFDVYWNATVVHVTNAMLKTHKIDLPVAFVAGAGLASATVIPIYQQIVKACKGDALKDPEVLASCRRISTVMRGGDIYVTELVGIDMAAQVWPESSPEYAQALAAKRVAHYRLETDGELGVHLSSSVQYAAKRLELMTEKSTEQQVALAEIAASKANIDPPADYREKWGGL